MSHGRGPMRAFRENKHENARTTKVLIKRLWGYLEKYKISLMVSGILILIYTLGNIFSPLIITAGLDAVTQGTLIDSDFLMILFFLFLGLSLLVWFLNATNTYILARVKASMLHDVRTDVFDRLVKADMSFHKQSKVVI